MTGGLRIGAAHVVTGGARVRISSAAPAAPEAAEPVNFLSEDQLAEAALFRPRLIEFGEKERETIVSARPEIREELVMARSVERRTERVEATLRRTEVEVEALPLPENQGDSGSA